MTTESPQPPDDDEPAFYWQDLNELNIADLLVNAANTLDANTAAALMTGSAYGELIGIVSEGEGGIIAYALGEEHANEIVNALRRNA